MRFYGYRFPEGTPENILLENGCEVVHKDGYRHSLNNPVIPDDKRELVDYIDRTITGTSLRRMEKLMKEYGGVGWVKIYDKDGTYLGCADMKL